MKILSPVLLLFLISSHANAGIITESKNAAKAITQATPIVSEAAQTAADTLRHVSKEGTKTAKEINKAASGVNSAALGVHKASHGINKAAIGINTAANGVSKAAIGINTAAEGIHQAANGVQSATQDIQTASLGVHQAATGVNQVSLSITEMMPTIDKLLQLTVNVLIIMMIAALIITATFMMIGFQVSRITSSFESTTKSLNDLIHKESKIFEDVKEIAHVGAIAANKIQDQAVLKKAQQDYGTLMGIFESINKFNFLQYVRGGLRKEKKANSIEGSSIKPSLVLKEESKPAARILPQNLQDTSLRTKLEGAKKAS